MLTTDQVYQAIKDEDIDGIKEYLINHPVNIPSQQDRLNGFLHHAINFRKVEVVKLLICYYASPVCYNNWAVKLAKERGSLEILEVLTHVDYLHDDFRILHEKTIDVDKV